MSTSHRGPGVDEDQEPQRTASGRFPKGVSGNPRGNQRKVMDHVEAVGDGAWANAMLGIGDARKDKRMAGLNQAISLDYRTIAELWERDAITAKAIEAQAAECFREGYELQIPDEAKHGTLKEDIEDRLEELGVDAAVEQAWNIKRAYGGSAILKGVDDKRTLEQPMRTDKDYPLEYLNVFEPIEIIPDSLYRDPTQPKYGRPEFYRINNVGNVIGSSFGDQQKTKSKIKLVNTANASQVRIHESRLIVFQGIKTSNFLRSSNPISQHWGVSEVNRFYTALRDHGVGHSAVSILPTDSAQPVIMIEGLLAMVAKNNKKLLARLEAIELSRSNARAILLDAAKEKYERQTTNLQGIPELLSKLDVYLAAVVGIPLSVLLGYSPATMGKPDDSELTQWYNQCRSIQRRKLSPIIRPIIKSIMGSIKKRGAPKKWHLKWHELVRLTEEQRANMYLTMARVDAMNVKSAMATSNELRRSRWVGGFSIETQVEEDKDAPGFLAPLPAGVLPGSTPAPGGAPKGGKKPGAPAAMGPNAHSVGGYARRNPTASALGANPKQGGDVAPRTRDADDNAMEIEILRDEVSNARARRDALTARGALTIGAAALLENVEKMALLALEDFGATMDSDGPGRKIMFAGFPIVIENERGSYRTWIDTDGTTGKTKMRYDYGYIAGADGMDGDSVDVYLGPSENAAWVYVIHQMSKASGFTSYDEDKCLIGFDSANHARDAYLSMYDDERFFGGMSQMTVTEFRAKLDTQAGEKIV